MTVSEQKVRLIYPDAVVWQDQGQYAIMSTDEKNTIQMMTYLYQSPNIAWRYAWKVIQKLMLQQLEG